MIERQKTERDVVLGGPLAPGDGLAGKTDVFMGDHDALGQARCAARVRYHGGVQMVSVNRCKNRRSFFDKVLNGHVAAGANDLFDPGRTLKTFQVFEFCFTDVRDVLGDLFLAELRVFGRVQQGAEELDVPIVQRHCHRPCLQYAKVEDNPFRRIGMGERYMVAGFDAHVDKRCCNPV